MQTDIRHTSTLADGVLRKIAASLSVPTKIAPTANLYTRLGFDSLSFVTLLLDIEREFDIWFELDEMEECLRVDRLVAMVERKVARRT